MKSGQGSLDTYGALANRAHEQDDPKWLILPKHHQFKHLLMDTAADLYNPRYYQGYCDEDFVRLVLCVATK
eukprot:8478373-Alexandrium_andersonii.AAC.1